MKVSVIVPIYKVERDLKRCIDSIIAQTYQDIEIILVDDGSPDKCGLICDDYAGKDNRIRVIHKENGGLSDARNAGLEIATGEWISFIDSDDWIEPNMYTELLDNAHRYGAEISVGGVNDEVCCNGTTRVLKSTFNGKKQVECLKPIEAMRKHLIGSWAAWDKIYRREVFEGIRFPAGEINEDEPIMLLLLNRCSKVVYTNEVFYHYVHRADSITTSSFTKKKLIWVKHCEDNLVWVKQYAPALENEARSRLLGSLLWAVRELSLTSVRMMNEEVRMKSRVVQHFGLHKMAHMSTNERLKLCLVRYLPFEIYRRIERLFNKR